MAKEEKDDQKEDSKNKTNEEDEGVDLEEELFFAYNEIENLKRKNSKLKVQLQEGNESKDKASHALEEAEKKIVDLKIQIVEAKRIEKSIEDERKPKFQSS